MVLRHQVEKPAVCQTSMKLLHCQVCGQSSRVRVCWSVITDVRITNTNGSTKNNPTVMAMACTATHSSTTRRRYDAAALALALELALMVAISVISQEARAATQEQRGEHHAEREQHQRDHARRADVEALKAEVVDQLRQGKRGSVRIAGLRLLTGAPYLTARDLPGHQRLGVVLHGRDDAGDRGEDQDRPQVRQRHEAEPAEGSRTVELRGFVLLLRHVEQRSHEDHHQ